MKKISFTNKTVWITGASSGIGEALAVEFAKRGAHLVLSARNADKIHQVAARCCEYNPQSSPYLELFDMADHNAFTDIVERVLCITGGVDVFVSNAGVGQRATALSTKPEVLRRIMDVNFFGPVFLTQKLLPSMIGRGSGRIVVISSVLGKIHIPGRSAYVASKHALQGYFDTLRTELHRSGIGITVISPGWISTAISYNALTADGTTYQKQGKAGRKRMSAEECAHKIVKAISSEKNEALPGGIETLGWVVKTFFPKLYDKIVIRRNKEFVLCQG